MSPQAIETNNIEKNLKVRCEVRCRIPTADKGEFYVHLYSNNLNDKQHLAIVAGPYIYSKSLNEVRENDTDEKRLIRGATIKPNKKIPLVRIHSECFTSETIFSSRCDCAEQLERSMRKIQEYGNGVVVYLRQEGRNIGLLNKMMAYNLQDNGYDTVEANIKLNQPVDGRNYTIAARILEDLQIDTLRLLTNNPDKIEQLTSLDDMNTIIEPEIVPEEHGKLTELEKYLQTKVESMNHDIPLPEYLIHYHAK
ncbi:hypothetical protein PIROE2DRAFT_66502 [Piromyces sp. E2]|nr:hypothetical protein PIROE2DRAFT_66502 [Piromyces sp. E2]|eukprot:OUM59820.1 hypothetical protein PIROE2DRAFT_66502 [Piromyces sp. E2]